MNDLISRAAAIERIESHIRVGDELYPLTDTDKILNHAFEIAASCVYNLPPARPEPLTGKEKMIFLAAMAKEENICKQIDDECRNCREPYEDSLVRTCHEITRKVKGALWTI